MAVKLRPEESGRCLEDLIRAPELLVIPIELLQALSLGGDQPWSLAGIDRNPTPPRAQGWRRSPPTGTGTRPSAQKTSRTARPFTSAGYLASLLMTPSSQRSEPPGKSGGSWSTMANGRG
jgi:hypothetical protein